MANSLFVLDGYEGLGTVFFVELFVRDGDVVPNIDALAERLKYEISSFDKTYSRFKEDSLLSKLNRERTIPYDVYLADMLTQAEQVSSCTNGVFDIFIKEKLEDKGYGTKHIKEDTASKRGEVVITEDTITLTGSRGVDLGGIGKGYLIDRLVEIVRDEFGFHYFLINGGGDMYVTSDHGEGVELFLEHPTESDTYLGSIKVSDVAFCSSSSFKRRWHNAGKEVNHFIAEQEVWAASYVIGESATITDMYATIFCILSSHTTDIDSLAKQNNLACVVIDEHGAMQTHGAFPSILL